MKKIKDATRNLKRVFVGKNEPNFSRIAFVLLFAVVGTVLLLKSFAATGQIYLVPASTSVEVSQQTNVALRINPGTAVIGVNNVVLTYDPAKLQYVSVDFTGSPFDSGLTADGTGYATGTNTITFNRGMFAAAGVSSDSLIANVKFKALVGSGTTSLSVTGNAGDNATGAPTNPAGDSKTLTLTSPPVVTKSASYTIESTNLTPATGNQFGLKVFVTSDALIEGGEVSVNLPVGLAYQGTLDTNSSAFSPATTVTGTTAQLVNLVFITQSQTLTGKQLVATIPVIGSTVGVKTVSFSSAKVHDTSGGNVPTTANPFSITISSPITKPIVAKTGLLELATSTNITDFKQTFSITNYDSTATYVITIGGQTLTQTSGAFSLPVTLKNGDHTLQVSVSKSGATESTSYQIRLRSPNVNRLGCVDYSDLSVVNKAYGTTNPEFDLDFNGTVGLIDLLTITANWATTCVN